MSKSDDPKDNKLPSMDDIHKSFKASLKSAVQSTNSFLASLEHATTPLVNTVKSVEKEGSAFARQAVTTGQTLYDRRFEYGPYLVASSSLVVGGIFAVRRGKLPGVLGGAFAGGLTYVAIYETKFDKYSDLVFGKKEE
jgi:hypothetical protein